MECLGEEVYTFPVFTEQYCQLLLEELSHIEQSDCPKGRPNTMNQYGVLLNEYNFDEGVLNPLRLQYLRPITSLLFPAWGGHCLDSHKGFTVHYQPDLDRELTCHFDNAEVTLNVALGYDNFLGGDLYFLSWNSEEVQDQGNMASIKCGHRPGWGVLHRGRHRHGAEAVSSGKRCNLIVWMRSSSVRNSLCPMCGDTPQLMHVPGLHDGFTEPERPVVDVCHTL
ncbi:2-oxoglutarate and iron-dependent oxygenase domain-containing protein 2-like isoform X2 [Babylonia areolata]